MSSVTTRQCLTSIYAFWKEDLFFFTLAGMQLLRSSRSCCVSLSRLPDVLRTALALGTLWVWGKLGSVSSFTASGVTEKSSLPTMQSGRTFDWAGFRLGSFSAATGDELVPPSGLLLQAAFWLLSLPLLCSD